MSDWGARLAFRSRHEIRPVDQHVMPIVIEYQHKPSPDCWCRPRIDYTDPVNGGRVWIHKAPA